MDHPIFEKFNFVNEFYDDSFHYSISGVKTKKEYEVNIIGNIVAGGRFDMVSNVAGVPYRLSEDYYEWIDLLTAIEQAEGRFVLLELGAGFGRWISNAALSIGRHKSKRLKAKFLGVEADHRHFAWMKDHLALNGIPDHCVHLINGAVAGAPGFELFPMHDVHATFGTGITQVGMEGLKDMFDSGIRFAKAGEGLYQIVQVFSLADCIAAATGSGELVDIIHMDIQGAEAGAIDQSIAVLNQKVKRMHIGTHSEEIETNIYNTLISNDWRVERFFRIGSEAFAEFGKFYTSDGLISTVNTRFS